MTTTEHDLDRIAYEVCGYERVCRDDDGVWWRYNHVDATDRALSPWSSTDAAIEHAERGKFIVVSVGRTSRLGMSNGMPRYGAVMCEEREEGNGNSCFSACGSSPGLAIRNAIVEWAWRGKVGTLTA